MGNLTRVSAIRKRLQRVEWTERVIAHTWIKHILSMSRRCRVSSQWVVAYVWTKHVPCSLCHDWFILSMCRRCRMSCEWVAAYVWRKHILCSFKAPVRHHLQQIAASPATNSTYRRHKWTHFFFPVGVPGKQAVCLPSSWWLALTWFVGSGYR